MNAKDVKRQARIVFSNVKKLTTKTKESEKKYNRKKEKDRKRKDQ